ncbi:MAG: hypothetical protein U0X20_32815 [Caldilineaceae bacterium]
MNWDWLVRQTMNDPSLWWAAFAALLQLLQTLLLLLSAVAIFWEMTRIRRETVQYKMDGLQMALHLLESPETASILGIAAKHGPVINAPVEDWSRALQNLSIVGVMVAKGYADMDLVLAYKGSSLAALGAYMIVDKQKLPEDIYQNLNSKYASARSLLDRAMQAAN